MLNLVLSNPFAMTVARPASALQECLRGDRKAPLRSIFVTTASQLHQGSRIIDRDQNALLKLDYSIQPELRERAADCLDREP